MSGAEIFPPATTRVTAMIIRTIPVQSRNVIVSLNTITPKNTAVSGSSAPSMAVGVEPMY